MISLIIIFFILFIVFFCSQKCKISFEYNSIIIKNWLNIRTIINVKNNPRMFIKHRIVKINNQHHTNHINGRIVHLYNLHIQQNDKDIVIYLNYFGNDNLKRFLDNIETKEISEISMEENEKSLSQTEKTFLQIKKLLQNQKRIIGIKDLSQKIKIDNTYKNKRNTMICFIMAIIFYVIDYILHEWFYIDSNGFFGEVFLTIASFCSLGVLLGITRIIDTAVESNIKISYPSDECIKINKINLNYKKNDIMIYIEKEQNTNSLEKYIYRLIIKEENDFYSFYLNLKQKDKIEAFINNVIFENKEKGTYTNKI